MKNHLKGFSSLGAFIKQRLISGFSFFYIMCLHRVSHSWGGGMGHRGGTKGAHPPHPTIFSKTPPSKLMSSPMGHTPSLKNEPPHLKNTTRPLKHEIPLNEMIPRKSTINNNLKSS